MKPFTSFRFEDCYKLLKNKTMETHISPPLVEFLFYQVTTRGNIMLAPRLILNMVMGASKSTLIPENSPTYLIKFIKNTSTSSVSIFVLIVLCLV